MSTKLLSCFLLLLCLFFSSSTHRLLASTTLSKPVITINWQPWSEEVFAKAKAENKLVLLDLHAVWCHWCHVMDDVTYHDPAVIKFINTNCIPVSVDQDSRPDLASRYQDYGWPATVIFNSAGKEREILSGFYSPPEFLPILKDCAKHPDNLASELKHAPIKYSTDDALNSNLKNDLIKRYESSYETETGGWTLGNKFLPADSVEYSITLAKGGDLKAAQRVKEVLKLQNNLLDPVWGGMYQYSTDNDWNHPHYEKIMSIQSDNLKMYSLGYLLFQDVAYLNTAKKIYQYLNDFLLSPDGAFYTSQDADLVPGQHSQEYFALNDQNRRKQGIPKIDKHIYSRENGWVIEALSYFYAATADKKYLDTATKCANWIVANRTKDGGFVHDTNSPQFYLADNLSMGKALLSLYAATGDRTWLEKAQNVADFTAKTFALPTGFCTAKATGGTMDIVNLDENVLSARFYNLLYHYTGQEKDKEWAATAMHYLATPSVSDNLPRLVCGLLLADQEITSDPFHIVIVGSKEDPTAAKLFAACQTYPRTYRQIEWLDMKEGQLPGQTVEYPQLGKAAAFTCSNNTCSSPAYTVEAVNKKISKPKVE